MTDISGTYIISTNTTDNLNITATGTTLYLMGGVYLNGSVTGGVGNSDVIIRGDLITTSGNAIALGLLDKPSTTSVGNNRVEIASTGHVYAESGTGVYLYGKYNVVTNAGEINADGFGIFANSARYWNGSQHIYEEGFNQLANSGVITSGSIGMYGTGGNDNLSNSGIITSGTSGMYGNGGNNDLSNSGVITSGSNGMGGTNGSNSLTNSGVITSRFYGMHGADGNNSLSNSGVISAHNGMYGSGGNNNLSNTGEVTTAGSAAAAIVVGNNGNYIFNQGTAAATSPGGYAVRILSYAGDSNEVLNTGTLTSPGIAVLGRYGDETITNRGLISGDVVLDSGADTLDNVGGEIIGAIDMGAGDDLVIAGAGAEDIDGGDGTDTVDYAMSNAGVWVDLAAGTGAGGYASGDRLANIENLVGSAYDDHFAGTPGANVIAGGPGRDTMSYAASASGVNVDLGAATAVGGDAAGDVLSGIENLTGSAHNDTLKGDESSNALRGGAGNDWIEGGAGADTLHGGEGVDTLSYAGSSGPTRVDLALGTGTGGDAQGDTLAGFENFFGSAHRDVVLGTGGDNVLTGNGGRDVLWARAGNDTLFGGEGDDYLAGLAGDDWLEGGAGADKLDGGEGLDTASYESSAAGVRVDLALGTGIGGDAEGDALTDFENLIGSKYKDTLIGTAGDNVLTGNGGNDLLWARGGNDELFGGDGDDYLAGLEGNDLLDGGAGNDMLRGGTGADVLDGGSGIDTAYYKDSAAGVKVDLAAGTGVGGDAEGDKLRSVENLIGSEQNDKLLGTGGDNVLTGNGGDDVLVGGAGNDMLLGGLGADIIDGGDGIDTASYEGSAAGVSVDLARGTGFGGDAEGDKLTSVENLIGSRQSDKLLGTGGDDILTGNGGDDVLWARGGDDTLFGGKGNDYLAGLSGDDTLDGGAGADKLDGGDGIDTLTGGSGADLFVFSAGWGEDTVTDFEDGVDLLDFSGSGLTFADLSISTTSVILQIEDTLGNVIFLPGISDTDITEADFLF